MAKRTRSATAQSAIYIGNGKKKYRFIISESVRSQLRGQPRRICYFCPLKILESIFHSRLPSYWVQRVFWIPSLESMPTSVCTVQSFFGKSITADRVGSNFTRTALVSPDTREMLRETLAHSLWYASRRMRSSSSCAKMIESQCTTSLTIVAYFRIVSIYG